MGEPRIVEIPPFGSNAFREYFRNDYVLNEGKSRYLGIKNGKFYLFALLTSLTSFVVYLSSLLQEYKPYFLLAIPVYFLFFNLIEYLLHRFPMHKKTKGLGFLFEHVTIHHSFYCDDYTFYEDPRDYMAVFLPILYFSTIAGLILFFAFLIYLVAGFNDAIFFSTMASGYYLMYELLHFLYHCPPTSIWKKLPFIHRLSAFHMRHHRKDLMNRYNFNITFPIFDYIFKTNHTEPK